MMKRWLLCVAVAAGLFATRPMASQKLDLPVDPVATFSILGFDPESGELGGAVQSRVFSVGNGVLWAEAGVGAAATQAIVDVSYGPQALELLRKGVKPADVRKHIFFAKAFDEPQGTLVAKKTPFTADEVKRLEERAAFAKMTVLVSPNTDGSTQLEKYLDDGAWSPTVLNARDELAPPTDDRPFFFFFKKFGDLFELKGKKIYDPGLWVIISLGSVLALGMLFILLPLAVRLVRTGMPLGRDEPKKGQVVALTYFGLVGFAFMAVEIALLQGSRYSSVIRRTR